jgi:hypothetical protein
MTAGQDRGDCLRLDRGGVPVALFGDGAQDRLGQAEIGEQRRRRFGLAGGFGGSFRRHDRWFCRQVAGSRLRRQGILRRLCRRGVSRGGKVGRQGGQAVRKVGQVVRMHGIVRFAGDGLVQQIHSVSAGRWGD